MSNSLGFKTTFFPGGNAVGGRVAGWPMEGHITQVFGQVSVTGSRHGGLDIAAPAGTPIRAPAAGVMARRDSRDFGLYALIDHPGTPWYSAYAHMQPYGAPEGAVAEGEVIGYCGNSGLAFGAHLHWAVSTNPAFALNFEQLRDPADFAVPQSSSLLETLADIVIRNGIEGVASDNVLDLFPAGTAPGEARLLTGDRALEYARRRGLSLSLGLGNLNQAIHRLQQKG